jgi:hypothetical protein
VAEEEEAAEAVEAQQRQVQRLLPATVEARVQPRPPLRLAVAEEEAAAEAAEAQQRQVQRLLPATVEAPRRRRCPLHRFRPAVGAAWVL